MSKKTTLIVDDVTCASCVRDIETGLRVRSDVSRATMNFADRTVTVNGTAAPMDLIRTISEMGYSARVQKDREYDALMVERESVDAAYYRQLVRHSTVALLLGVPLMIYGIITGDMTIDTPSERNFRSFRSL